MKHLTILALALNFTIAYAQQRPVRMSFSGSMIPTALNAQPNSVTDEELLAGTGSLGSFTLRKLRVDAPPPLQPPSTCSGPNRFFVPVPAGAGVFRFQSGSLLTIRITQGSLCIDGSVGRGELTETYQITGGTGRFRGATGTLRLTATLALVFADSSGSVPLMLTSTGEFEGTIQNVGGGDEPDQERP